MNKANEADKMNKTKTVLLTTAGSVVGLLAGGISAGLILYWPAALLAMFVSGGSDDGLGTWILIVGLGVLAGATMGAALGANIVQKVVRQTSSFRRALLGAVAGATIGVVCGLTGFGIGIFGVIFFMPAPIVAGALIGSGWKAKANEAASSRVEPWSSFARQGNETHCKKCGFELIGPGGPCRKCDDVQTKPCASCGLHVLLNDRKCPHCGTDVNQAERNWQK